MVNLWRVNTNGEVIPLNKPINLSSLIIVVTAWKVEEYFLAISGFWKRTLTGWSVKHFEFHTTCIPVSNGNPTTKPAIPCRSLVLLLGMTMDQHTATVPAKKSSLGSSPATNLSALVL